MDPTPIAANVYAQYGALGLLALSGWMVAWFLWSALTKARADLITALDQARKDADERQEKTLAALMNNTQAITLLAERLRGGG